jgi:hypothetical protein
MNQNICKLEYFKLKMDPKYSPIVKIFNDFESNCIHDLEQNIDPSQKTNIINDYAFYCGLKFGIENFVDLINHNKFNRNKLIIDTMNIFQNTYVLIVALSVINFSDSELDTILKIMDGTGKGTVFFNQKINLFAKIMTYFYGKDSTIFFIVQGNEMQQGCSIVKPYVEREDCQLFVIYVPCFFNNDRGKRIECAKKNIKNESDDVVSLLLFFILKNMGGLTEVIFWTYDNYNWYKGPTDMRQIQLKYLTDEKNLQIELIIGSEINRKNQHVQATIINFNGVGHYAWHSSYYIAIINYIYEHYNKIDVIKKILSIYATKVINYMNDNGIKFVPISDVMDIEYYSDLPDESKMSDGDMDTENEFEIPDGDMDVEYGFDDESEFKRKYLKYKKKYLELKNKIKNEN